MDNERHTLENEEDRLNKMIGVKAVAAMVGLKPKYTRVTLFDSSTKFHSDKINTTQLSEKSHHKVSVREVERFIRENSKK